MSIKQHHRGGDYGRGDDPHGVTASNSDTAMNFDPDTTGFRREVGPLEPALGKPGSRFVGSYLGRVGTQHFFSPEATGGGASDSLTASFPHLAHMNDSDIDKMFTRGERYVVEHHEGGGSSAQRYYDGMHGWDALGAPHSENNRRSRTLPGQTVPVGNVVTGNDHSRGVVGSIRGYVGDDLHLSAEATGGGESDSLSFRGALQGKSDRERLNNIRDLAGQRVVVSPMKGGGHQVEKYDPALHKGIPGANKDA